MFRIKICGMTSPADAQAAQLAGADAVGFNFYRGSGRFVDAGQAAAVGGLLSPGVLKVGVFVNAAAEEVRRTAEAVGLDLVQLHGDEPPEYVAGLGGVRVMRAFRLAGGGRGLRGMVEYLEACERLSAMPAMVLMDAMVDGAYGGTGRTADWKLASEYHRLGFDPPLVLAGGLRPDNVAEAIAAVRPQAVDTASGVEREKGRKDPRLVADFVAAARLAFATDGGAPRT